MLVSTTYPEQSTHVAALDLRGQRHVVEISHVTTVNFDNKDNTTETKLVVHMKGKEKTLVLNKTNASCLASWYGDNTDMWCDKRFEMYPTKVDFGGKMVDAIRLAPPPGQPMNAGDAAQAVGAAAAQAQAPIPTAAPPDLDDSIPF